MKNSLLSRDGFQMPTDGWYQIAPLGEFTHAQAGLVQVVDGEACDAMVNRFQEEANGSNFAGLLVDFDHFSLDGEKRSEAAGWITALEARATGARGQAAGFNGEISNAKGATDAKGGEGAGLWAKIRWSDVGEEAVKGGRYRFLSPVWSRSDCVDLGNGRVRPMRLLNAAVTNDPNLKGMAPLSNSGQRSEARGQKSDGEVSNATAVKDAKGEIENASRRGTEAQRFKWVLGETVKGHCPSCAAVAGQVHTMAEWEAAGVTPGSDALCCQGNCHCVLEPTTDAASGALGDVPVRKEENRLTRETAIFSRGGAAAHRQDVLENIGWTDEARVASLAVRRAKAKARSDAKSQLQERQRTSLEKASRDYAAIYEQKGLAGMTPEERQYLAARIAVRVRNGSKLTATEQRFLNEQRAASAAPSAVTAVRQAKAARRNPKC